ncbi:MAG TPA: protein kinase, partial [Kofleriaceae bacterium]|nr:protein kinase [Kofleriaceae bacterium]
MTTPPSPPPGRKSGSQQQGLPISEDYGDYNDFESDATNVNQIPQASMPVRPSQSSQAAMPPQMFPQASPQVSHMGALPVPNPMMMQMPTGIGTSSQPGPGPAMTQVSGVIAQPTPYVSRSRIYAFVVDETGMPIELGSGRFAKAYLGEERWVESKTTLRRPVAIKCLQRGVTGEDQMRFQMEKEILERVQGHPNIVELLGSGEGDSAGFIPPSVREKVENDFMILELLDMSLEERLKGARQKRRRDDLLAVPLRERIFRVLEYIIPVATAVEFSHLVRDTCHRDIKPANILVKLADPNLRGSQMKIKLADFNVGKVA